MKVAGLSTSVMVSWPPVVIGALVSLMLTWAPVMTAASLLPVTVMVMVCGALSAPLSSWAW